MLIHFRTPAGTLFIDVDLARLRIFCYDEDEWQRVHSFGQEHHGGLITDGTLEAGEVARLRQLLENIGTFSRTRPNDEFHGMGLLRLTVSDRGIISDSSWPDWPKETTDNDPVVKLATYLRRFIADVERDAKADRRRARQQERDQ
jgi:hypothetical protein